MEMIWFLIAASACFISWSWGYMRGRKDAERRYSMLLGQNIFSDIGYDYSAVDYDYSTSYTEPVIDTTMSAESGVVYDFSSYRAKKHRPDTSTQDDGIMAWTLAWSEQEGKYVKIERDPTDPGEDD